ncbi:hypothetical protein [Cereibacter sphaeroides]|uniref:hypothetical protein n=1 Tax=Cereibacter sphaeroides TaxID=1063 RepID=UPI000191C994|nr:hypothetical protein [Cereibacter sphaeroides]ACM02706.1 Hypothetical Protein RSKD131_2846 [Cereibacter sphaeroides KD131]
MRALTEAEIYGILQAATLAQAAAERPDGARWLQALLAQAALPCMSRLHLPGLAWLTLSDDL